MSKKESSLVKSSIFFAFYQISDITAYQSFILLIFTFYFTVIGIEIWLITTGYIIWAVWNALNDPLLGYLSDKTHTRWGRRRPWIMASFIPLGIFIWLLYTPVLPQGLTYQVGNFIYFLIVIIIFEFFYTMFSLNSTSMFPEVFLSKKERTTANNFRQVFTIIGLIVAFILPGIIIGEYTDPSNLTNYQIFGIIAGVVVIICAVIFLKFSPREKAEFKEDSKEAFSLFKSMKFCIKSRSFRWYIPAEIANWFVYGILPTIVPLYAEFVLNITDAFLISLLLGITFISAAIFMTILWKPLVRKIGNRKSWMISLTIWFFTLLPLMFISDMISGMIVFTLVGIGLSGSFYIIDLIVADIIDEDELATGIRREAGYYGVNAFFLRFSNVFVILAIGTILSTVGWTTFEPTLVTPQVIFGLRSLMFIFPGIAIIIAILAIYRYPLDGEKLVKIKEDLKKIHEEKRARI
ncbi:MAG: MFS transporter [Promethearchaeota archaeon]